MTFAVEEILKRTEEREESIIKSFPVGKGLAFEWEKCVQYDLFV